MLELPFEKAGSGRLRDFLWWPSLKGLDLIQVCLTQSAQPLFPPRRNPQQWSEQAPSLCEAAGIQIPHSEGKGAL